MRRCTVLVVLVGCASAPPPQAVVSEADAGAWSSTSDDRGLHGAMYDYSGRPLDTSSSVTFDAPTADRFAPTSIGPSAPPPPARPRRVGKRNISLRGARLDNALRLLAREGDFNLVVQGELTTPITLDLKGVEPYEAALLLAEVNDLDVRYQSGIVVVGRPSKP